MCTSIDMVYHELASFDDELSSWVKDRKSYFMSVEDDATQETVAEIVQYLFDGDYKPKNRDDFLAGADPWLIAKAKTLGATVVTSESYVPENSKKVKIPNICEAFSVEYIRTFEVLRNLKAKLILEV